MGVPTGRLHRLVSLMDEWDGLISVTVFIQDIQRDLLDRFLKFLREDCREDCQKRYL